MVLFKINGERNSGTNFLKVILLNNGFPVFEHVKKNGIMYNWKHGVPQDDAKYLNSKVVDIFVFRELHSWVCSMYHNNYHLEDMNSFEDFILLPQRATKEKVIDYKTGKPFNSDDDGKTIIELREFKFQKICEYRDRNKDVIFVNLSFIQNESNMQEFLGVLRDMYMPNIKKTDFILNIPHTKISTFSVKNRIYDIDTSKYADIIRAKSNESVETFINGLTYKIYNSSSYDSHDKIESQTNITNHGNNI